VFRKRGVQAGDYVYIVANDEGYIWLIGRMIVGKVLSQDAAADGLGSDAAELWNAEDHLIAHPESSSFFNPAGRLQPEVAKKLLFLSKDGAKPLKFNRDGMLDSQTLRGVRELLPASAKLLEEHLSWRDKIKGWG